MLLQDNHNDNSLNILINPLLFRHIRLQMREKVTSYILQNLEILMFHEKPHKYNSYTYPHIVKKRYLAHLLPFVAKNSSRTNITAKCLNGW